MISAPAALSALTDNYIWAFARPHDGRAVVVDPGDAAPVDAWLAETGRELALILVTHHHPDHVAGVRALVERHRVPVFAPDDHRVPATTRVVREGDRLDDALRGSDARVIEIPGHTRSHIAYVIDDLLFCGDTLFGAGCGRLFEGTPAQMHQSLSRLASLPAATRVFCGHEYTASNCRFARTVEPDNAALRERTTRVGALRERALPTLPTTIGEERATNPFLRIDQPAVRLYAVARGARADDPVSVFATLRAAKDAFA